MSSFKFDIDKNAQYQQINLNSVDDIKSYTDTVYEGLRYAENYEGITTTQDAIDIVNKMYLDKMWYICWVQKKYSAEEFFYDTQFDDYITEIDYGI